MLIEGDVPNRYTVMINFIQMIGPILATVVTYMLTRKTNRRIEDKADVAASKADVAAVETIKGNGKIEEMHKTVNGRTDALIAENQQLKIDLAKAQTIISSRRSTD
jgi:hypothetical protein